MSTDIDKFQIDLESRKREIEGFLQSSMSFETFKASLVAAVSKTPDLLGVDQRSLYLAVSQAASDGLLPDGKRAVIMVANQNNRKKLPNGQWQDNWSKVARYQPMIEGIRERAFALDNIIMSAEVVYEGDKFEEVRGLNPDIRHIPLPLCVDREKRRGQIVGCYAVFAKFNPDTGVRYVLHFEVLDMAEIQKIRSKSQKPDGFLWKDWFGEACKKSAVHRGKKSVPVSPRLASIINRWEDNFDKTIDLQTASSGPTLPPAKAVTALPAPERAASSSDIQIDFDLVSPAPKQEFVAASDMKDRCINFIAKNANAPDKLEAWFIRNRTARRQLHGMNQSAAVAIGKKLDEVVSAARAKTHEAA
jgi:recombinational DNA repair protein RecT